MRVCEKHPELMGERYAYGQCKACACAKSAQYRKENPDKVRAAHKAWHRKHPHKRKLFAKASQLKVVGFTPASFALTMQMQGNCCAICRTDFSTLPKRSAHADHCHKTGAARGVLCSRCNHALGLFADSAENMRRAIAYLKNPPLSIV